MKVFILNIETENGENREKYDLLHEDKFAKVKLRQGDHYLYAMNRYVVVRTEYNAENGEESLIVKRENDTRYPPVEEVKPCRFCGSKICGCC